MIKSNISVLYGSYCDVLIYFLTDTSAEKALKNNTPSPFDNDSPFSHKKSLVLSVLYDKISAPKSNKIFNFSIIIWGLILGKSVVKDG